MAQETFSFFIDNAPAATLPLAGLIPIVQADGKTHAFDASLVGSVTAVVVKIFTVNGTYTPTAGMVYCIVEAVGGGSGGSSDGTSGSATGIFEGGGGGAGEYARSVFTAATIGVSKAVVIGAFGAGGAAGGNNGGAGGTNTTLGGTLLIAVAGSPAGFGGLGGNGGHGGTGQLLVQGGSGGTGRIGTIATISAITPLGGESHFGLPGTATGVLAGANNGADANAEGYGAGGNGAAVNGSTGTAKGGAGRPGVMIITEFIHG